MKKNLMSVIILALVFANFVLTGLLAISIIPQTKNANSMIEKVCTAIDLELESGGATGSSNMPIDQLETYSLNGGEAMTMSFATGDDGQVHYLVANVSLSLNTKSADYATYGGENLVSKETIITSDINTIVHQYTMEQYNQDREALYDAILEDLQNLFKGDFVVAVNFSEVKTQ